MSKQVLIHFKNLELTQCEVWEKISQTHEILSSRQIRWEDFPQELGLLPATVIIPSLDIIVKRLNLPKGLKFSQQQAAVASLLEEQLLEDISQLHFSISSQDAEGNLCVAVINRHKFELYKTRLGAKLVQLQAIIAEASILPYSAQTWSVFVAEQHLSLKLADQESFSLTHQMLPLVITQFSNQAPLPEKIRIFGNAKDCAELAKLPLNKELQQNHLWSKLNTEEGLNLLGANHKPRAKFNFPLRNLSLLGSAIILLGLSLATWHTYALKHRVKTSASQMHALYYQVFPQAKTISAPKERVTQLLKELANGPSQSVELFSWLNSVGEALLGLDVQLQGFSYNSQGLSLELSSNHFETVEQLLTRLKSAQLKISQENASQNTQGVRVKVWIRR